MPITAKWPSTFARTTKPRRYRSELRGTGSTTVTGEVTGFHLLSGSIYWGHAAFSSDEAPFNQHSLSVTQQSIRDSGPGQSEFDGWALSPKRPCTAITPVVNLWRNHPPRTYSSSISSDGQGPISGTLPWKLPWRVAIVGKTFGPIVESSVVENLNPPCELTDISWIKSGRCSWSYITQDNDHSVTLQEHYVDFASQMGWEYNTTDWNFDKTQMPGLVQYANQKNVNDELWYDYSSESFDGCAAEKRFPAMSLHGDLKVLKSILYRREANCNQSLMKWHRHDRNKSCGEQAHGLRFTDALSPRATPALAEFDELGGCHGI